MIVVWWETEYQDGHEDHAKVFASQEAALKFINKRCNPWGATNEFRMFELGKEIPLQAGKVSQHRTVEVEEKIIYSLPRKRGRQ